MLPEKENSENRGIGVEKGVSHIIVSIIQYVSHAVLTKTILKKTTGNITVLAFDTGEEQAEIISPFDTFIQIIDGSAEIFIGKKFYNLRLGEGLIIPGHSAYYINAREQFKMISTTIKSGYEGSII